MAARPGSGREPPGRAGRLARRSIRYPASHALCGSFEASAFNVADEAKNLRPDERRLGTLEIGCCRPIRSEFVTSGSVDSVLLW